MVADIRALVPFVLAAIAVLFTVGGVVLFLSGRRYAFVSGRVSGVVGELGGGKSMFTVARVLRPAARTLASRRGLVCKHSGRRVRQIITNFTFLPEVLGYPDVKVVQLAPAKGVSLWQQIIAQGELVENADTGEMELRLDAVICVDEMSLFCPSDAMKLDPLAKSFLVMVRKWNAEFWWMSQDALMVHKRVRRLSQRLWFCSEARGAASFIPARMFQASGHKPDSAGDLGELVDRKLYLARRRLLRSYRSYETIAASAEDLEAIDTAMEAAGLKAGESRKNVLATSHRRLAVVTNNNGPHPQISNPESATRSTDDDDITSDASA